MYSHKNDLKFARALKEDKKKKQANILSGLYFSCSFNSLGFVFSGFSQQVTQLETLKHFYIRAENPPESQGCRKETKYQPL